MVHYPRFRTKALRTKILVGVLGLLVFVTDILLPANLNVAIFYCLVIVLCAWTGSRMYLWGAAAFFSGLTVFGLLLSHPPAAGTISWIDWGNRLFGISALLLVALCTDFRMRAYEKMERALVAKEETEQNLRESELRLKLAQVAANLGSWEWDPAADRYYCSEECYGVLGVRGGDVSTFALQWMGHVHPEDLDGLRSALRASIGLGEFDFDYRYQHPSKGLRWIHTRAKMFELFPAGRRLFGIHQDVTERKRVEALLQQSQSTLESLVEQRTIALRKLSAELLQSQDEERRRIARELHDSFGQYLASLKINLDILSGLGPSGEPGPERREKILSHCLKVVQRCIAETRTLSYLLHPALLDEAGFPAAARWYVEGFAERSGIQVRLDLPSGFAHLPPSAEMGFFRVLQECLTNAHRYSGSASVDVIFENDAEEAVLIVRDYGRGIPPEVVNRFREQGTGVGVGLSSMRERMAELGGRLEVLSGGHGTTIRVSVPLNAEQDSSRKVA